MSQAAQIRPNDDDTDAEVALAVRVIRSTLEGLPSHKRDAVKAQLADLLDKPKTPQRGGKVLNNVIDLFKRDDRAQWNVSEIMAELAELGVNTEPKPVYNALTYLDGMKVIRRIGYGKYQLADGRLVDGLP